MKEKYIFWRNLGSQGWCPSEEYETLGEVINVAISSVYGQEYKITKLVNWKVEEVSEI